MQITYKCKFVQQNTKYNSHLSEIRKNAGLSPLRLNPAFFFFSQSHATVAFQDFLSFLLVLSYGGSANQILFAEDLDAAGGDSPLLRYFFDGKVFHKNLLGLCVYLIKHIIVEKANKINCIVKSETAPMPENFDMGADNFSLVCI